MSNFEFKDDLYAVVCDDIDGSKLMIDIYRSEDLANNLVEKFKLMDKDYFRNPTVLKFKSFLINGELHVSVPYQFLSVIEGDIDPLYS